MADENKKPRYKETRYLSLGLIIAIVAIVVTIIIWLWPIPLPPPSDFSILIDPMLGAIQAGGVIQTTVSVMGISGYDHTVSLSATGQPSGVVIAFVPPFGEAKPSYTSSVMITVDKNVPADDYTLVIKGTGADGTEHSCNYILTVKRRAVTPTPTPTPTPFEKIEGLTSIRVGGGLWDNWDADLEKDGPVIDIVYLDARGDIITDDSTKTMPISADVKLYASDSVLGPYDKLVFSAHYTEDQIILGSIYPKIRIPKEEISVSPSTEFWCGAVEMTIYTPKQGTFADGEDFIVLYEEH